MPTYGVTDAGFVIKDFAAIRSSLAGYLRDPARLGAGLDLSASSPLGQIVDAFALELASAWEVAQAGFPAIDPAQGEGAALTNAISGLFNFPRLEATPTTATVTLTGTAATVIPAGSQISQSTTGDLYATTAEATIGGGGTVSATVSEVGYASRTAVPEAPAGTLTVIESPVSGWTGVTNPADAVPGSLGEPEGSGDAAYRTRFEGARATGAKTTAAALYAALVQVDGVNQVLVRENLTSTTDGLSQPGKSFWVVVDVDDSADTDQRQELAAIILANRPAGIQSYGGTPVTVLDPPAGTYDPVVYLTYSVIVPLYVRVLLVGLDGTEASSWQDDLEAAILAVDDDFTMGSDVIYGKVVRAVYGIPGIVTATIYVGTTNATTNTANLSYDPPNLPRFDSSRIEITEAV